MAWVSAGAAQTFDFDLPKESLATSLRSYAQTSGQQIIFSRELVDDLVAPALHGNYSSDDALKHILNGTQLIATRSPSGAVMIERAPTGNVEVAQVTPRKSQESATPTNVETVVVTAEKKSENIQQVPIAITALSQQELTARQIAGGPDLVKEVPNLTFSKTNFSGYNLEIRGIGTQAISVTTDPAVAVAFNSIPFIRNHFFEQEFYDLQDAEVLRGPQGTLYGRNATAGVVNIVSAKPTDQFEAMGSVDFGNYGNQRLEGMMNIPIVGDKLDIRFAGEWTKRDGYTDDTTLNTSVDGRDLWSSRLSIGWKPSSDVQTEFVWEHFSEDDERLRTSKQLCKTDPGPTSFTAADGTIVPVAPAVGSAFNLTSASFSQGCAMTSLNSPQAFEVPNGFSLPFVSGAAFEGYINTNLNPYASTTQSTNLRDIQSAILPHYRAKNDTLEFNVDWKIDNTLTLTSQTGYNHDFLYSTEDYNRFDTTPGIFQPTDPTGLLYDGFSPDPAAGKNGIPANALQFCDPQLGCSDRLILQDLSDEHAWQMSQEFRLASNFAGPANFSVGGNVLHYETEENYYVFSNTFTMISGRNICPTAPGPDGGEQINHSVACLGNGRSYLPPAIGGGVPTEAPQYIDPNPLASINTEGHNYFVSQNPYNLNSYALFGEMYYDVTNDLKLTAGARWTDDQKHFTDIPSQLLTKGYGYPSTGIVDQTWERWTGRFVANWTPNLPFTDQSMFYASYAHGYKAGGANPPGPVLIDADTGTANGVSINVNFPDHPLTFKPEYIEAFELGTKNTALGGTLVFNADVFYYNYTGYQISEIVDRSALNLNFNANVKGAEIESTWEPLPGLKFSFAGGYETSSLAGGSQAIDLMARANQPGWTIMKPSVGQSSNCVFPNYVAAALVQEYGSAAAGEGNVGNTACGAAYFGGLDPVTGLPYVPNPTVAASGYGIPPGYPGYNPLSAPNNGEGFDKNLTGNQLPNAPHFTTSLTAEYTMPVSPDWAATLHGDFYWQSQQWARVFEDPIDKIHGYSNVNLSLILTNDTGWQVMGYVKNVFNVTAITGTFLNSDDSGLTTNIFLTDPRLYGVRITKQLDGGDWPTGGISFIPALFADNDNGKPPLWIELGGQFSMLDNSQQNYAPPFQPLMPSELPSPASVQKPPKGSFDWDAKVSFEPSGSDWIFAAEIRYGRSAANKHVHKSDPNPRVNFHTLFPSFPSFPTFYSAHGAKFADEVGAHSESHAIMDFTAGKDVGLGSIGMQGSSVVSGGLRLAQFTSHAFADINTDPDYTWHFLGAKYHDVFEGNSASKHTFHGIGPELKWDASTPILGNDTAGSVNLDWGLNGAILIGKQRMSEHHETSQCHVANGRQVPPTCMPVYAQQGGTNRSRMTVVPNIGGAIGLSYQYSNAKVSFGYRADEFFGAMDSGLGSYRSSNIGFFGPYAKLSIGLGG